jgi:cold shock CspA family protein
MNSDNTVSELVKQTVGRVKDYNNKAASGWISFAGAKGKDAFLSHRHIVAEGDGLKPKPDEGQPAKYDLHKNSRGYIAMNVELISESEYETLLQGIEDDGFNK